MTLHRAREIAYDAKAKTLNRSLLRTGCVSIAVDTLEEGRAVEHRRDSDRRLARHLRLYAGMADAQHRA